MTTVITPGGPIALPYTDVELTAAINQLPTPFGQMTAEGFFPAEPLTSPYVEVNIENGVLTALPVTNDGPATIARHGRGDGRIFKVPAIKHLDDVKATDIRGMLALADRSRSPETLANLMNKRLMILRRKFNLTWELMRTTAIKGVITDGAGVVIYDLFAAFEIAPKTVYFDLDNAASDIQGQANLVFELITQDLSDEVMTGVEARVSSQFFSKLIGHPKLTQFYLQAEQAVQLANVVRGEDGGYRPRSFAFGGILFKEMSAVVPMWGGTSQRMIAQGKGHAYPAGTLDTHVTYIAPPEDISVLNGEAADIGDAIHITTEPMKHKAGVEMQGQMNALTMWRRPKLLVQLDAGPGTSTALAA